jgi:two-component system response regulator PilR (NtrC family)
MLNRDAARHASPEEAADLERPQELSPGGNGSLAPSRILIMEDNPDLRHLYSKSLRKFGYEVHSAATLQEARALLEDSRFDVFLCDIQVGSERGTDLLLEQQAILSQSGTQVVILSAYPRYRPMADEMGVDFYLEKPVSLDTLLTMVKRLTTH